MWDFEHPPASSRLAGHYQIDWMLPSECADRLADGTVDLGLVPIAALAANPALQPLPGCTIASKDYVRSLILVHKADQPLSAIRTVAADTASRTTIAYSRILFQKWGNGSVRYLPMAADLDAMLAAADAAILIGDPALLAVERRGSLNVQNGQDLAFLDLAHEWRTVTGLPFVSAVWAVAPSVDPGRLGEIVSDLILSRDHGLAHIKDLAVEWSQRLPLPQRTIERYLAENIHYVLDDECIAGMEGFFEAVAKQGILPRYQPPSLSISGAGDGI